MRQALTRMLMAFIMTLAGLVLINLLASKMAGAQEYGPYDWTFSHHNRGERGWASSAFQEQHGPRVKGTPRYRPGGDRPYRRYYRPRTMVTDEVIRPDHGHHHGHSRHYYADPRHEHRRHHHKPGTTRRDATGDVQCWPHVEAYSTEANSDDGAWKDAQRNFENAVRAMYGEKWMSVENATAVEKQCWASSGNQSVAGRVAETVGGAVQRMTGNDQGLDGRKHRCRIMARPCQAPKEFDPMTKADKR
jgi:hypothetical protein